VKNSAVLKSLKNQLRQFGLNPEHWIVWPRFEKNRVYIFHAEESGLSLIGEVGIKRKQKYLRNLQLCLS
jgi:hypothetical protein